ncbi:DUF6634 family protein [Loktanella sp. DJP18]|uniref:DUF6634 family protein n=1 Tax=Loktanella sp. DJP18 TaxID=3409788 RepID=UPI003BB6EB5F
MTINHNRFLNEQREAARALDEQRFQSALDDAARTPTDAELEVAPILHNYAMISGVFETRPMLIGEVEGHTELRPGMISTSGVVLIDTEAGFARTQSRWYRLGTPADFDDEAQNTTRAMQRFDAFTVVNADEFAKMIADERALLKQALEAGAY